MIIEIYDAQDSDYATNPGTEDDLNQTERSEQDDEDKILYTKIGKTEILIDKILTNLLIQEVRKGSESFRSTNQ